MSEKRETQTERESDRWTDGETASCFERGEIKIKNEEKDRD